MKAKAKDIVAAAGLIQTLHGAKQLSAVLAEVKPHEFGMFAEAEDGTMRGTFTVDKRTGKAVLRAIIDGIETKLKAMGVVGA
ncbi:MAG TPA: hypothetical protein VMT89_09365 [Candidatus Acidoferrales bacterium]|nr:hypothetical protein [Candidatus Acidoferrales bacterium]